MKKNRFLIAAALSVFALPALAQYGAFRDPAPPAAAPQQGKTQAVAVPSDKGLLVSDREKIDFGNSVKVKSAITATLVNIGGAPLTIKGIRLTGVNNGFSVSGEGCAEGLTLAQGDACPLTVSWTPGQEGLLLDAVQIAHDGARGVLVVPVSATGGKATCGSSTSSSAAAAPAPQPQQQAAAPRKPLGKYTVVSRSGKSGVITGPAGRFDVRDGEALDIAGVKYTAKFMESGIVLEGGGEAALLPGR